MNAPADPDDPFAPQGSGRTFIVPRPGGRPNTAPPAAAAAPAAAGPEANAAFPASAAGINPLVALASNVLALVPQLQATLRHPNPAALKEQLAHEIREFERRALESGMEARRVMAARYILCTVLDEAAADTPWGGAGVWAQQSLLVMFHNEAWGGEKVFQLMAELAKDVPANRDLLELIYACLALGFEGRFRLAGAGSGDLDAVRARLAQLLRSDRGEYAAPLSPNWNRVIAARNPLASWTPLWVTLVCVVAVLGLLYFGLSLSLARRSDEVSATLQSLRLLQSAPPPAVPAATPRLAQFLGPEIRAGLVTVADLSDRSTVTIQGDNLFAPGSNVVAREHEALLGSIGAAIARVPGLVVVAGHTDDQPIRTLRYPSNWELSKARATTVAGVLEASGVPVERLRVEGKADTEPLNANGSPEQRARNRRVEITVLLGHR